MLHVRRSSFPVEATTLTRDVTPDSRLIEIAQIVKHPHQHPSEEGAAEGAINESDTGVGTTAHAHPGSLSFVQKSEIDDEVNIPAVGDVPPADAEVPYEAEPEPENRPAEVPEPVRVSTPLIRQLC